jgi:histidinol phosphatase-like PHP family hydrolase
VLDNATIAELLMREAAAATGYREKAFQNAAHSAFMWPEEAASVAASGRPLTELEGVGHAMAKRLYRWLDSPPKDIEPPPLRQEFLTLAQARRALKRRRDWSGRLQGDLQMHTEWSDGSGTIVEMAAAGAGRGYRYIAITDHTQGLQIAHGLGEERLHEQGAEIAAVNTALARQGIELTVLRSAEMNLSPKGEGDMPSACLRKLDIVLGCFHSALRTAEDQTARYMAGLRNPDIQILGHPQTRMYNRRPGLRADWARVFAEAARLDKAVEIDGYADRQDLRMSLLKVARQEGVRISLGTDAHHPDQLAFMELGMAAALLAKIPPERIVNFMPLRELQAWVGDVRNRQRSDRLGSASKQTSESPAKHAGRRRSGSRRSP